jgi:hypothetical protein
VLPQGAPAALLLADVLHRAHDRAVLVPRRLALVAGVVPAGPVVDERGLGALEEQPVVGRLAVVDAEAGEGQPPLEVDPAVDQRGQHHADQDAGADAPLRRR